MAFIRTFQSSAASRHVALTHASGLLHTGCAQSMAAAQRADPQTSAESVQLPQGTPPPASVSTAGPPDGAAAPVTWLSKRSWMNMSLGTHTALWDAISPRDDADLCDTASCHVGLFSGPYRPASQVLLQRV